MNLESLQQQDSLSIIGNNIFREKYILRERYYSERDTLFIHREILFIYSERDHNYHNTIHFSTFMSLTLTITMKKLTINDYYICSENAVKRSSSYAYVTLRMRSQRNVCTCAYSVVLR